MKSFLKIFIAVISIFSYQSASAFVFPFGLLKPTPPPYVNYSTIPTESNRSIQRWIHFFSVRDRARFDRFMLRGASYQILVQKILSENGVPPELYYLGMIESGYASRARSFAQARGIWQLMPATAREAGLRVDRDVDERLDIIRSTRAASKILKNLNQEFGSWYLAMAAYNCGEGCVRSAVRRGHSSDFWTLTQKRVLPKETAQYIPKFQAAMQIARRPETYGFVRKMDYRFPQIKHVRVQQYERFIDIARRERVSIESIRALNPHLVQEKAPPSRKGYDIWVPMLAGR